MVEKKELTLTIFIGRDIESDYKELFSSKLLKEMKIPRNSLYLDSYEQLDKLLSPKRMDLLRYLIETQTSNKPKSLSEIARALNRHQEAISRDISQLRKLGLVMLKRLKQTVYAIPMYSCIDIRMC